MSRATLSRLELATVACWLLLLVTGFYLLIWYRPTAAVAYSDMEELRTAVTPGLWIRRFHQLLTWPAVLLPLLVATQRFLSASLGRGFFAAAAVGAATLGGITGWILPWDQLALWTITTGTTLLDLEPAFGLEARFTLVNGTEITTAQILLLRLVHISVVPGLLLLSSGIYASLSAAHMPPPETP